MRRNIAMRIALVLCVLAVFFSCVVGTTFAKYVTSDLGEDRARVSRWGVVITATDRSSFRTEYAIDDLNSGAPDTVTVKSSTEQNVVAPGTKDAEGIVFTITGTPEVATKIDIQMTVDSDIFIDGYYPVVFTLTQKSSATGVVAEPIVGNLDTIKAAIEAWAENAYYAPNTNLDAQFTLTWEWKYDNEDLNSKDTLLGSLSNGNYTETYTAENRGEAWSTDISYSFVITISQITK